MKDGVCRMTCCSESSLTVKLYTIMNAMWPQNNEVLQILEFVVLELRCYYREIRGLVAEWLMNGRSVIHDQN
jgi:hypothetical protein